MEACLVTPLAPLSRHSHPCGAHGGAHFLRGPTDLPPGTSCAGGHPAALGGAPVADDTDDSDVLLVARVCVHSAAFFLELILAAAVFLWADRKYGVRCPACGEPMKIIDKWFKPVTTYLCPQCHYRQQFRVADRGGG